jgi:hypothetical protein
MKRAFLFVGLLALAAAPSVARYHMGEKKTVKDENATEPGFTGKPNAEPSPTPENPEAAVIRHLSSRYSIGEDKLQYFRSLHFGYEEIVPALIVAQDAQVEPGKVLDSRIKGKTWKNIADDYFIDLKPLNKKVLDELTPIRKRLPESAMKEKPQVREEARK